MRSIPAPRWRRTLRLNIAGQQAKRAGQSQRSCMRAPWHFLAGLVFLLYSAVVPVLHAQSTQQSTLVEGARREGKLVWYTSMAIDTSKPLVDAFEKEYPFIKTELVRAGEEQLMIRILGETRAGKWNFDMVSNSAISTLADRKIIGPYLSP